MKTNYFKTVVVSAVLFVSTFVYAEGSKDNESKNQTKLEVSSDSKNKRTPIIEFHAGDKRHDANSNTDEVGGDSVRVNLSHSSELENILVPVAFFVFLIVVIIGGKYISSRNEQRRLEVLKLMLEKGQPVPETVINQILSSPTKQNDPTQREYRKVRNAVGFTIAGVALIGYAMVSQNFHNKGVVIPGLVFICLGLGGLAGLYFRKGTQSEQGTQMDNNMK